MASLGSGGDAVASSPAGSLSRKLGVAACAVVAVVASVVLLAAAHTSLDTTSTLVSPGQAAGWRSTYANALCLQREFHVVVPKGSSVYLGDGNTAESQSLLEAATLWAHPVARREAASWDVSLQPGRGCAGLTIVLHRSL